MSPAIWFAVAVTQLALVLGGSMLLWRLGLSAKGRHAPVALTAWDVPISDLFLFLWLVMCGGFIAPYATSFWLKWHPLKTDFAVIVVTAMFHLGMLAGLLAYRAGFGRRTAQPPAAAQTNQYHPVLAGAAAYLVTLPVVVVVGLLWQGLLKVCQIDAPPQEAIDILRNAHPLPLSLLLLSAIVLAPFTEELIFRAGIYRYARTRLPRWAGLLLPACLFSAMHLNLASFAPLVALGIMFSLAYERTGRISTTIIAHALFNLSTTALVLAGIDV